MNYIVVNVVIAGEFSRCYRDFKKESYALIRLHLNLVSTHLRHLIEITWTPIYIIEKYMFTGHLTKVYISYISRIALHVINDTKIQVET